MGCLETSKFEQPVRMDAQGVDAAIELDTQTDNETCERVFVYRHAGDRLPSRVQLAGDFELVPWSASIDMDGPNEAGEFVSTVRIAEGLHRYKFVVDGVWLIDPENPDLETDDEGNQNSAVTHMCPFEPSCVRNAECEGELACRNFQCEPCSCAVGQFCEPGTKRCVDTLSCDATEDCPGAQVCRGGQCSQCIEDTECTNGERCLAQGCGQPVVCWTRSAMSTLSGAHAMNVRQSRVSLKTFS